MTVTDNQRIIIKGKTPPFVQDGNGNHILLQIDLAGNLEYAYVLDNTTSGPFDNRWNSVFLYDEEIYFNRVTGAQGQWNNAIFNPTTETITQVSTGGPPPLTNPNFTNEGFRDEATPIFIGGVSVCPTIDLPNNVNSYIP